jgi:hypothetical protein
MAVLQFLILEKKECFYIFLNGQDAVVVGLSIWENQDNWKRTDSAHQN